jgi:hypothetical protein
MTEPEWRASVAPPAMIRWLEEMGHDDELWEFTVTCCRRVWDDLPGETFRRVVEHFEQIGVRDIEDSLAEASQSLDKLERRIRGTAGAVEQTRLSRKIGFGRMVLAFEHQDAAGAANSISGDLIAWADDADEERRLQAELLRQMEPSPFRRDGPDEDF